MKHPDAVVLDTNVMISALISPAGRSADAVIVASCRNNVLQSSETLDELREKLGSRRLAKFLNPAISAAWFAAVSAFSTPVDAAPEATQCRDVKDNKFIDLAVSGEATMIVSGDKDLQVLGFVQGRNGNIPVISPSQFLDMQAPLTPHEPSTPLASVLMARRPAPV